MINTSFLLTYWTSRGRQYCFGGWGPTGDPVACFERGSWMNCLHGCMLCLSLLNDPRRTQLAVEDDGLLHELLHLASGVEICTFNTMDELRALVVQLVQDFEAIRRAGL